MIGQAVGLAFLSALSPTAMLVATAYLGSASPKKTSLYYLAGAVLMSAVIGVIVILALRAGGLNHPHQRTPRYGLRLGLGVAAFAIGVVLSRRKPRPAARQQEAGAGVTADQPPLAGDRVRRRHIDLQPVSDLHRRGAGVRDRAGQRRAHRGRAGARGGDRRAGGLGTVPALPHSSRADHPPAQGIRPLASRARARPARWRADSGRGVPHPQWPPRADRRHLAQPLAAPVLPASRSPRTGDDFDGEHHQH